MQATQPTTKAIWSTSILVFCMAVVVYAMAGNLGRLHHDDAIFFYGGQEMLRGTPVYQGIFDHKGPLGQMVCGLGAWLASFLGKNDLITTRYLFLGIASATAAGMFLLGTTLFRSRLTGFLTSAVFVSFWGYGALAFSGTRPKMLMVLFEVAALIGLSQGRWLLAGMSIALGAFAWQPLGIFIFVALALAWLHTADREARRRALGRTLLGALVPSLLVSAYFLYHGAFGDFIDGCFRFNLEFLENPLSFGDQANSFMTILVYNGMGVMTLFGLLAMPILFCWRRRESRPGSLLGDRFAGLLFTFPFPVLWSLQDFQQYPDFYIFLPYVALGLAWLLHHSAAGVGAALGLEGVRLQRWIALPGVTLAVFSCCVMRFARNEDLAIQWAEARQFEAEFGDARTAIIGHPEALVLLDRPNVTRYGFIMRGIAAYIDDQEPGGFAGWLESISRAKPEVLIVDESYPDRLGVHAESWTRWLSGYERLPEPIGRWSLFVPRADEE